MGLSSTRLDRIAQVLRGEIEHGRMPGAVIAITRRGKLVYYESFGSICDLEWKIQPTVTIERLANRHRVVTPDGVTERVNRERVFVIPVAPF